MPAADRATLDTFVTSCALPKDVKRATIFHPDLDETWVHFTRDDLRATVSFCDDDESVYVVLRAPESPRRVFHDSPETIAGFIGPFFESANQVG